MSTGKPNANQQGSYTGHFYKTLIGDSLNATLVLDADGIIKFASDSVETILGYQSSLLIGENGFSFIHADDIPAAMDAFHKESIEQPELRYIHIRLRRPNAPWLWCLVRGHNLLKHPHVNGIAVYIQDDSMRKQAIDALRESEHRFRNLIRNLKVGVILKNRERNVVVCNQAFLDLLHLREEDVIGHTLEPLMQDMVDENGKTLHPDEVPFKKVMLTGCPAKDRVIGLYVAALKKRVWLLVNAEPVFDEGGQIIHVVCSALDITERKRLEQELITKQVNHQRQLSQATIDGQENERREIGRELHDNIGQQLTTIKLFLDLARTTADSTTNEMISLASKGVGDVINEVRNLSRALVPFTLRDLGLVDSIEELIGNMSRTQLLNITFDHNDFKELDSSETRKLTLFRIVQEQLNNIVKHAQARAVSITLRQTLGHISLIIKDDGIGFNINTVRGGSGFTSLHNRVELLGGRLKIMAAPGEGCLISVIFPIQQPEFQPIAIIANS
jgi:PAS domain S-box-containing protein